MCFPSTALLRERACSCLSASFFFRNFALNRRGIAVRLNFSRGGGRSQSRRDLQKQSFLCQQPLRALGVAFPRVYLPSFLLHVLGARYGYVTCRTVIKSRDSSPQFALEKVPHTWRMTAPGRLFSDHLVFGAIVQNDVAE